MIIELMTNLENLYKDSQSGKGCKITTIKELMLFFIYCDSIGSYFHSMEVFELREEGEVPRIDMSMYGSRDFDGKNLEEKIKITKFSFLKLMEKMNNEGVYYNFIVWTSKY